MVEGEFRCNTRKKIKADDEQRLRWQVYPYLKGYDYKNSISNGCFFNIGARLARYTGNMTYADEAKKIFDWSRSVGFIADNWDIYDGAHISFNCSDINKVQFSYNMGVYIQGAANMYNLVSQHSHSLSTRCQILTLIFSDERLPRMEIQPR